MMSRHFRLSSELSGVIGKRFPHAINQLSAHGSFFNQFVTDIDIYVVYYKRASLACATNSKEIYIYVRVFWLWFQ